jgi:hypothetical protein
LSARCAAPPSTRRDASAFESARPRTKTLDQRRPGKREPRSLASLRSLAKRRSDPTLEYAVGAEHLLLRPPSTDASRVSSSFPADPGPFASASRRERQRLATDRGRRQLSGHATTRHPASLAPRSGDQLVRLRADHAPSACTWLSLPRDLRLPGRRNDNRLLRVRLPTQRFHESSKPLIAVVRRNARVVSARSWPARGVALAGYSGPLRPGAAVKTRLATISRGSFGSGSPLVVAGSVDVML